MSAPIPTAQSLGKVAVLMGGKSGEREISFLSGNGVLAALRTKGVDAHPFDTGLHDLGELKVQGFQRCFIALHGRFGEDGTVQGALELLGIPYTGSGVMASAIAIDKLMTKRIWAAEGLPTPPQFALLAGQRDPDLLARIGAQLGYPLIVKPSREGSSLGVTKVANLDQFSGALELAGTMDADILVEKFIAGEEVTCPILGQGEQAYSLPIVKIVAPDGQYDYQAKYFTDDTQYLVPCGLPADEIAAINALTLKAYRLLGARGWGRLDVMIDRQTRQPYLLELNTSPGMTGHSLVPMAAKAAGMSYEDLCLHLLTQATLDYPAPPRPE
jgi:D-alanine-D-alanine ligase